MVIINIKLIIPISLIVLSIINSCNSNNFSRKNERTYLFPVEENGKWGYINQYGELIIPYKFDGADDFYEGLAGVKVDSLWGFIDTTGIIVIKPNYNLIGIFSEGFCSVGVWAHRKYDISFVIKRDGTIAFIPPVSSFLNFKFGRSQIIVEDEVWIIDTSGSKIINIDCKEAQESPMNEGILRVYCSNNANLSDSTKYFDKDGKLLLAYSGFGFGVFRCGLAKIILNDTSICYVDKKGNIKIKNLNRNYIYEDFSENRAVVFNTDSRLSGVIDTLGNVIVPYKYKTIYNYHEGLAAFCTNDEKHWGFLNQQGDTVIHPFKDEIWISKGFFHGLCKVISEGNTNHWGYINKKGEFVWHTKGWKVQQAKIKQR